MLVIAVLLGLLAVIAVFVMYLIGQYNVLVLEKEKVSNARSHIAVQIESRWDALSSLISATKQYATHEKDTLDAVVSARGNLNKGSDVKDIEKEESKFQQSLTQIVAIAEAYPELKASNLYSKSMDSVDEYEKNVRLSRMTYNDSVTMYNRKTKTFPQSIIAGMFGFTEEAYFEGSKEKKEMPAW